MNRTNFLVSAVAALLVFMVVHHIWANWGLVTIHASKQPLSQVITSIQRQGHVTIQTDLPLDTPVSMNVVKVPAADAIETLSVATEARSRLLFYAAATKTAIKDAESACVGGNPPDSWKTLSFQMGSIAGFMSDDTPALDPRQDPWNPKTSAPAPIQTFFLEAAQATNASFAFPSDWNPTVPKTPGNGNVDKVIPRLVSAAGGKLDQVFFLSKGGDRGPRPRTADGQNFQPDFDLLADRVQNQINRLPEDQRADAQAAFDSEQAFRKSLATMSQEQKAQAFQQHMQDPAFQQMMANRMDGMDGRMSHDQRVQHNQNYVNRKLTAMGKM